MHGYQVLGIGRAFQCYNFGFVQVRVNLIAYLLSKFLTVFGIVTRVPLDAGTVLQKMELGSVTY